MAQSGRAPAAVLAVCLAALAPGVLAQTGITGAAISGTVRAESGAPLPGATITVTHAATNLARTTATDARGRYLLAALPLGPYVVRAEHPGFQAATVERVVATLGQGLVIDLALAVAASETVFVYRVDSSGGLAGVAVAAVVGERALAELPTNGRDFVAFTLLTPGVSAERTPAVGQALSSGLSFAGQRARSNNVMVDGFDNNQLLTGGVAATFSQDAVQEFQVLAASFPAEFGSASGGVVNTVTRSGTNELHGGAFFYLRDDALNARSYFEEYDVYGNPIDAPKAPYGQAQWGATLGGPIARDRTFFFLSYEQFDVDASTFVTMDPAVADALVRNGFPVELGAVPYAIATRSALLRLDHNFGPRHRLMLRGQYSRKTDETTEPFGGIVARSRGLLQRRTDLGLAASLTSVFGSGWVSEGRLQVANRDATYNGLDPTCGGPCEGFDQGGPEITLPGRAVAGRQFSSPSPGANLVVDLEEALTRVSGRHVLKAGAGVRYVGREATIAQDMGGRYTFTDIAPTPGVTPRPLNSLEAFEAGLPSGYSQGYGDPTSSGTSWMGWLYLQDRFQVSPKLTLEAGARYQWYTLGTPPATVSDLGGTTFTYEIPGHGDLAPRLAAAFDPTGRGRTSLHAAFGVFHDYPLLLVPTLTEVHDGVDLLSFQARLPLSAQAWGSPGRRLPQPQSFASRVVTGSPGFRVPFSRTLSLGVDHELLRGLQLAVDLLWVRGKRQLGPIEYNPLVPALGLARRPNDANGTPGTSASIQQLTNYGESWYKGLTLSLHQRSARFEARLSYTLSEAEDLGSDVIALPNNAEDSGFGRDPADPTGLPIGFDAHGFRGPSAVDQRHRFALSAAAELPWKLRLSGIVTLGSGRPYTAVAGFDFNRDGVAANDRARRLASDPDSRVGRNAELTPDYASVDVRLARRISLSRRLSLDLMVEAFNLLDRVNFSDVNSVFGTGSYPSEPQRDAQGRVTYGLANKAYAPRQVQLAARVSF